MIKKYKVELLFLALGILLLFSIFQYSKIQNLQKNLTECEKRNNQQRGTISDLEDEIHTLKDEKEELEDDLEDCRNIQISVSY